MRQREADGYVPFDTERALGKRAPAVERDGPRPTVESALHALYDVGPERCASWPSFCAWCAVATRAEQVLVVDQAGQLLGTDAGDGGADRRALGLWVAGLCGAATQPAGVDGPVRSLAVELDQGWISCIRVPGRRPRVRGPLVVVVSEQPLYHAARQAVARQAQYTEDLM